MAKLHISSVRNNLDLGFTVKSFGKLFKAPSPFNMGVLACGPHKAFALQVKVSGRGQSSVVLEAIDREEEVM